MNNNLAREFSESTLEANVLVLLRMGVPLEDIHRQVEKANEILQWQISKGLCYIGDISPDIPEPHQPNEMPEEEEDEP
jgi:hypothetical protein